MLLEFVASKEEANVWDVMRDGQTTGDVIFQRGDAPGRYFLLLKTATLNVMGAQMSYRNLDEITNQLRFYYSTL